MSVSNERSGSENMLSTLRFFVYMIWKQRALICLDFEKAIEREIIMVVYKIPEMNDSRMDKTQKKCATPNAMFARFLKGYASLEATRQREVAVDPPSFNGFPLSVYQI
jgi:hypothetical protein